MYYYKSTKGMSLIPSFCNSSFINTNPVQKKEGDSKSTKLFNQFIPDVKFYKDKRNLNGANPHLSYDNYNHIITTFSDGLQKLLF